MADEVTRSLKNHGAEGDDAECEGAPAHVFVVLLPWIMVRENIREKIGTPGRGKAGASEDQSACRTKHHRVANCTH